MTTFKVNPVEVGKKLLPIGDIDEIIKHRCGGVMPEAYSACAQNSIQEKPNHRPNTRSKPVEINHGLVSAVHACWSNHYPLVLSPDMIWLCIAQGLAQHINLNAEKLRSRFVEHEGKKTLEVKRLDFAKGSPSNKWPEVFEAFSEQIRRHVGDKTHDLLTPTFSTTGPVEKAAAQIVLMDCFKEYFNYLVRCVCGIPEITLEGTVEDWMKLREKALLLAEFDLEWWTSALEPILDQFVAAASGSVDREFWCKIYNRHGGRQIYTPGPFVTGWILTLFPYTHFEKRNEFLTLWQEKDPASHAAEEPKEYSRQSRGNADKSGFLHGQFPAGVSSTPFTFMDASGKFPMHFYAGFMTVSQDPTTMIIRPEIGWAVADDENFQDAKTKSKNRFW